MDEQQFLNEINAIPWEQPAGNDDYRNALLVFADWLEERGDSRSELIRLREGLLNDPTPEQRKLWEPRMQELIHNGVQPIQATWENSIGMKFCWCPPGTFMMGSPETEEGRNENENENENQVHVTLARGFWMGKYEVTQGEWERLMGTTLKDQRDKADKSWGLYGEGSRYPMYYVNHDEVLEYCRKLTAQEKQAGRLQNGGEYRLPTEAQWEYACRAGTTSATLFGDELSSKQANFDGRYPYNVAENGPYLEETSEVGRYPSNAWELYDMHGNVWEWCQDWFGDELPGGTDPTGASTGSDRVSRGGSWISYGLHCRSANRDWLRPDNRFYDLGFRVALVPSGK